MRTKRGGFIGIKKGMKRQRGDDCIERMQLAPNGHQKWCSTKVFRCVREELIVNKTRYQSHHSHMKKDVYIFVATCTYNSIDMDITIIALIIGCKLY